MGDSRTLTPRQKRFVAALATSDSIRDAAAAVGIAESTAWRWLRDPEVKAEIRRRQDDVLAGVTSTLVQDMTEARLALRSVLRDKMASPAQRTAAARVLLDVGLRFFEALGVAERLAVLEDKMRAYDEAHEAA